MRCNVHLFGRHIKGFLHLARYEIRIAVFAETLLGEDLRKDININQFNMAMSINEPVQLDSRPSQSPQMNWVGHLGDLMVLSEPCAD